MGLTVTQNFQPGGIEVMCQQYANISNFLAVMPILPGPLAQGIKLKFCSNEPAIIPCLTVFQIFFVVTTITARSIN